MDRERGDRNQIEVEIGIWAKIRGSREEIQKLLANTPRAMNELRKALITGESQVDLREIRRDARERPPLRERPSQRERTPPDRQPRPERLPLRERLPLSERQFLQNRIERRRKDDNDQP